MLVQEGRAILQIDTSSVVTRKMPVFYNPVMRHNRQLSLLVLEALPKEGMIVGDALAGSGVRGIRLLKELPEGKIREVILNDRSQSAAQSIQRNLEENQISSRVQVLNLDANLFLRQQKGFDYLDIDPFGSPNPFLDAAVQSIRPDGVLAVTATDTASLCGSSPNACRRKYWAEPLWGPMMHEMGVRILARKVQLVAAQYEKAFLPIYSFSRDHYMRIFFQLQKGGVESILEMHCLFQGAGPLWMGQLWDDSLAERIGRAVPRVEHPLGQALAVIAKESRIPVVGFIDLHRLCSRHHLPVPKNEDVLEALQGNGIAGSVTHFCPYGIRTTATEVEMARIIKNL